MVNKNRKQIAEMSSEEIRDFINLTVKLKKVLESKETREEVARYLARLKKELDKMEASDEFDKDITSKIIAAIDRISESLEESFKLYSNFLILYMLSIITYPHATFARYPNKILPPERYGENLGIVQYFSEIADLLGEVINSREILKSR